MFQEQLINNVVEWERRLEYEEEQRKSHWPALYVNDLPEPRPCREARKSLFARLFQRKERHAAYPCTCKETQPC